MRPFCFIWSKDRAMQLHGLLSSLKSCCKDLKSVQIIVSINSKEKYYVDQYRRLLDEFPEVFFYRRHDLRYDVLSFIQQSKDFFMFQPDDVLFYRDFYLEECFEALNNDPEILNVDFLHGKNTTFCTIANREIQMPEFHDIGNLAKYRWIGSDCGFGWPFSGHVMHRKEELFNWTQQVNFSSPNTYEDQMVRESQRLFQNHPYKVCFQNSVSFTSPLHSVQTDFATRVYPEFQQSKEILAKLFDEGKRIDHERFKDIVVNAPQFPIKMEFK